MSQSLATKMNTGSSLNDINSERDMLTALKLVEAGLKEKRDEMLAVVPNASDTRMNGVILTELTKFISTVVVDIERGPAIMGKGSLLEANTEKGRGPQDLANAVTYAKALGVNTQACDQVLDAIDTHTRFVRAHFEREAQAMLAKYEDTKAAGVTIGTERRDRSWGLV